MDETMIIEVWDTFKEYISEKHKDNAAVQYVDYLLSKELPIGVIEGYIGYDSHLDDAIKTVVAEEKGFDEEEEDLDDFDEDEDY